MEKINLIFDAANKVIAREGYYNTKVQMIANEANIAVGTIYNYFDSKEAILDYIFKDEFEKRIKFLNELEKNDDLALNKIKMFLEFHLNEFIEDPNKMRVIAQEIVLFTKYMSNSTKELLIKVRKDLGRLIEMSKQNGEIRDIDSYSTAIFIFHSVRSVVYTKQFEEDNKGYKQLKNEIIEFIINGLKKYFFSFKMNDCSFRI